MGEAQPNEGVGDATRNGMFLDGVLTTDGGDGPAADGGDAVPGGAPYDDVTPYDDRMPYDDVLPAWEVDAGAPPDGEPEGPPPDWPPDVVPVVFWPVETLRTALRGVPGVQLARVVAEVTDPETGLLADLPDDALGDLVVASGRLQSWSAGVQARVVAERAARESHPLAHNSLVGQVTSELVVTEPEATEVVVRAESGTHHPSVIGALETGRIDARKAHTLLRSATQLTVTERAEAIRRYLPHAPRRTWKWLQRKMLAFAKSLHGAAKTARAEAQRRSVHVDRAENDMGWISAYLPAPDAAAVWGVVDDMAHQLRHTTSEDRTLAQLRADSLTGIVTGRLLPADRFTETETGTDTDPDTDTDLGANTNTNIVTDADSSPTDAGLTANDAGTEAGATATDGSGTSNTGSTDISIESPDTESADTEPADAQMPGVAYTSGNMETPDSAGTPDGDAPVCTCGGKAPVQQVIVQEIVQPLRVTPTRPVVRVTIPASTLLGLDDAPGDLAGYGPIPAETARTIAQDATWQRLLTDPVTGILTDYSTTTYKPGKVLRAAVEARDDTCMFLTCDTPGTHSDLDHIEPFDHDRTGNSPGQTRAQNLQPLCRKHHLLKTHAGWGVVRDPDTGITTWTTPTGRTHTRLPTVLDTHIDLDQIDPDTSGDLTLRALTGQHLPRSYQTTEPGAVPSNPNDPGASALPDQPPF